MSPLRSGFPADAPCCRVQAQQRLVDHFVATTWPYPLFAILIFDDDGLLVITRDHTDIGLADIEAACGLVVELAPVVGVGTVILLSFDPGFGTDPSPAVCQAFLDTSRRLEALGSMLVEWWLVGDGMRESVASACDELAQR